MAALGYRQTKRLTNQKSVHESVRPSVSQGHKDTQAFRAPTPPKIKIKIEDLVNLVINREEKKIFLKKFSFFYQTGSGLSFKNNS